MNAFPDTSFLCALYRQQTNSKEAASHFAALPEALHVSALLLFEFRQSVRFQVFRQPQNPRVGFTRPEGLKALADLQSDLTSGAVVIAAVEWPEVCNLAERLSAQYVMQSGHRSLDVLHVATALQLGAREFLTFDGNQQALATAEGLTVKP